MNTVYFSAQFYSSASDPDQCPDAIREVAFAGRSNAGKSSAINTLTQNGKLARIGKTPGRTQLINHFSIGEQQFLVDLPGYGYAQVSKQRKKQWQQAMTRYLVTRQNLKGLVLVMDIRHALTDSDWQLIELMESSPAELHVLLTKSDKLSRNKVFQVLSDVQRSLSNADVVATLQDFSSHSKRGLADLHTVLDQWFFDHLPESGSDPEK